MMDDRDMERSETAYNDVSVVVKWFNPKKGFGFVQAENLFDGDAFLHISVAQAAGYNHFVEGTIMTCDLQRGERGVQVVAIHSVDSMPSAPPRAPMRTSEPAVEVDAAVKFFNREKGFGFAIPDSGGPDIFISGRLLQRLGIDSLRPTQRVRLDVREGPKGPIAEGLEVLS